MLNHKQPHNKSNQKLLHTTQLVSHSTGTNKFIKFKCGFRFKQTTSKQIQLTTLTVIKQTSHYSVLVEK